MTKPWYCAYSRNNALEMRVVALGAQDDALEIVLDQPPPRNRDNSTGRRRTP
jgi:hypothetical protein